MDDHRIILPQEKDKITSVTLVFNVQCPFMKIIDSIIKNYITKQSNERIIAKMRQQMISLAVAFFQCPCRKIYEE